jgi:hypothetical protein
MQGLTEEDIYNPEIIAALESKAEMASGAFSGGGGDEDDSICALLHRLHQSYKKRMRHQRTRLKFWMSLCGNHKGMINYLYYFHQFSVQTRPRNMKSAFFKCFSKGIIKFIPMTMSLSNQLLSIQTLRQTPRHKFTFIASQSHCPTFRLNSSLMFH